MQGKVLVVDVGGSHVKLLMSPDDKLRFDSGSEMRPRDFISRFREAVGDLHFDVISIGFPAPIRDGELVTEPKHLGEGWRGFDFGQALQFPVRLINDAAMQALGSHVKGRTLFLGLGTGLGSALVWENNVLPLELGDLPYRDRRKIEDFLGIPGLQQMGKSAWREEVHYAVNQLKRAFVADTVVLGGGNVHNIGRLPPGVEHGHNRNAFLGGCRLWETDERTGQPRWHIL